VAALELGEVGPGPKVLGHELPDGPQHPQAGAELGAVEGDGAVAGQRLGQLQLSRLTLIWSARGRSLGGVSFNLASHGHFLGGEEPKGD
jgi:hypothetical protein